MDLPTQTRLKDLRDALELRLAELRGEVHAAELARRAPLESTDVNDRKDEAVRRQAADIGDAQERRDIDEMGAVLAALERLDAGRYGDCDDCGAPIGLQRLRVQPAAARCTRCQRAHECRPGAAVVR